MILILRGQTKVRNFIELKVPCLHFFFFFFFWISQYSVFTFNTELGKPEKFSSVTNSIKQLDSVQLKKPTKQLKTKTESFATKYWTVDFDKKIEISVITLGSYIVNPQLKYGCKKYLEQMNTQ
jgi:hypothetical protein